MCIDSDWIILNTPLPLLTIAAMEWTASLTRVLGERMDLRQGEPGPDPESISGFWTYGSGLGIRTSDPDDFQNSTGTSLFKVTFVVKFPWRSYQFIQRYEPNCRKMTCLTMLKNPLKIPRSGSGSGWRPKFNQSSLSTDTSVIKFSWRSVQQFLCKVANRQTNEQTDKRRAWRPADVMK